ncbi:hypothetical protein BKA57DRAFT_179739 [Linnemannia elongata]|nr:hypothetical protein BKA57DRAFT_179739 [Linnemannia elongata]
MALNSQRRTSEGLNGDEIIQQRQARAIGSSPTTEEPRASFSGETEQEREDREVVKLNSSVAPPYYAPHSCLCYQLNESRAADIVFVPIILHNRPKNSSKSVWNTNACVSRRGNSLSNRCNNWRFSNFRRSRPCWRPRVMDHPQASTSPSSAHSQDHRILPPTCALSLRRDATRTMQLTCGARWKRCRLAIDKSLPSSKYKQKRRREAARVGYAQHKHTYMVPRFFHACMNEVS